MVVMKPKEEQKRRVGEGPHEVVPVVGEAEEGADAALARLDDDAVEGAERLLVELAGSGLERVGLGGAVVEGPAGRARRE